MHIGPSVCMLVVGVFVWIVAVDVVVVVIVLFGFGRQVPGGHACGNNGGLGVFGCVEGVGKPLNIWQI